MPNQSELLETMIYEVLSNCAQKQPPHKEEHFAAKDGNGFGLVEIVSAELTSRILETFVLIVKQEHD